MCGTILSRKNSRYQGPEAELSWESREEKKQEPHPAGFQPGCLLCMRSWSHTHPFPG